MCHNSAAKHRRQAGTVADAIFRWGNWVPHIKWFSQWPREEMWARQLSRTWLFCHSLSYSAPVFILLHLILALYIFSLLSLKAQRYISRIFLTLLHPFDILFFNYNKVCFYTKELKEHCPPLCPHCSLNISLQNPSCISLFLQPWIYPCLFQLYFEVSYCLT